MPTAGPDQDDNRISQRSQGAQVQGKARDAVCRGGYRVPDQERKAATKAVANVLWHGIVI